MFIVDLKDLEGTLKRIPTYINTKDFNNALTDLGYINFNAAQGYSLDLAVIIRNEIRYKLLEEHIKELEETVERLRRLACIK